MRFPRISVALSLLALTYLAAAQEKEMAKTVSKKTGSSDATYTAKALAAAPKAVAKDAGVARYEKDGTMKTIRESKNGFTCMVIMGDAMCADANSMAFFDAMMKKENPPDKLGLSYMLSGDNGASNTDPTAEKKTADNHWVVTGPHVMIVGPGAKSLGLSEAADVDPTKPYMMWAGTPYEHAMIPVAAAKSAAAAKPMSDAAKQ
jgi:uncharacterized protein YgiM (DUF1202 family)